MKKLSNLKDVKALSKKEQKSVNGGWTKFCDVDADCPHPYTCQGCLCRLPGDSV